MKKSIKSPKNLTFILSPLILKTIQDNKQKQKNVIYTTKDKLKLFFNLDHKSGRLAAIVIRAFLQHFEKRRFFTGFLGSVRIVLLLPVAHEIVALSLEFLTDLICEFTLDPISASV